jgi:mono/diheme cytochrome c family protein
MPAFPALNDADIAVVQAFLAGLCPAGTATGSDLYAGNCQSCHGIAAGGTAAAPSVRCATRVPDALTRGRGAAMPSFPGLVGTDRTRLIAFLGQLCTQAGRTGMDLYAGNCSGCHGATARGGRDGLGVRGPGIRCTGTNDYREKVRFGDDEMPAFPALGTGDVDSIAAFVHGAYCPGG